MNTLNNRDIDLFIRSYVTKRQESLLNPDLEKNRTLLAEKINGRNALVIGGAGTIGSFYIKALLKFRLYRLVVVDINENGLTELVRDLRSSTEYNIPPEFITYPMNFGDRVFEKMFRSMAPFDIVANFAAHKHVRSEKDVFSIEAMIENNVLRARRLLDLLLESPPEHFFCVSTDKAANPVNIMGASKKLMEELIMAYSDKLKITTARFANVAFSNGSLPQGFLERLGKSQPWSCPLDIRRFFVSPQESGELCMIASVLGESGDIIFPKLDEERDMISFDSIARDLLRYLGLEADVCRSETEAKVKAEGLNEYSKSYPVYFFETDTSGEKPYEEFFTDSEIIDEDRFMNLGVIKNSVKRDLREIDDIFARLRQLFDSGNVSKASIVDILKTWLPDFDHIEKGKGLDSKM
ncbi:MAG: polysaccharide biosynthesis protein [Bacteroidales bacterium]|nr:polysaccharide biosynthesis protein [Bacteroidales bacterium]